MNKLIFLAAVFFFSIFLFVLSGSVFAQQSRFYHLDLLYDKGKLEVKTVTVLPGSISQVPKQGEYQFELVSFAGTSLYRNRFQILLSIHGEEIDPKTGRLISKTIEQDNAEIILNAPYFPNGKQIVIFDQSGTKVLEIPVVAFAKLTPSPAKIPAAKKTEKEVSLPLILGGFFVLVAIIGLGYWILRKKSISLEREEENGAQN